MDGWGRGAPLLAGRYRLDELIGRDRIAEVWRGHDLTMGRSVTIKLLTERKGSPEGDVQPRRRPRVSHRVGHSTGDRVLDVGTQDGRTYVVLPAGDAGSGAAASGSAGPPSPHLDPYGDSHGHEGWPTGSARPRDPAEPPPQARSTGSADASSALPASGRDAPHATTEGHFTENVSPRGGGGFSPSAARPRRPRRLRVGMAVVQGVASIILIGSSIWLVIAATPSRPSAAPPASSAAPSAPPPSLAQPTAFPPATSPPVSPDPSGSAPATSGPSALATPPTRKPATRPTTAPSARPSPPRTAPPVPNRTSSRTAVSRAPASEDQPAGRGGPQKQPPGLAKHSDEGPKLPNGKTLPGRGRGGVPPGQAR